MDHTHLAIWIFLLVLIEVETAKTSWTSRVGEAGIRYGVPLSYVSTRSMIQCFFYCGKTSLAQYNEVSRQCGCVDAGSDLTPVLDPNWIGATENQIMLMRVAAGQGDCVRCLWESNTPLNEDDPYARSLIPAHTQAFLSSAVLDPNVWSKIKKIEISLYVAGSAVFNVFFFAEGSTRTSWFAPGNIRENNAGMTSTETYEKFWMRGQNGVPDVRCRNFHISIYYNGCNADFGYLLVMDAEDVCAPVVCSFENAHPKPAFLYADQGQARTIASMPYAEVLVFYGWL